MRVGPPRTKAVVSDSSGSGSYDSSAADIWPSCKITRDKGTCAARLSASATTFLSLGNYVMFQLIRDRDSTDLACLQVNFFWVYKKRSGL